MDFFERRILTRLSRQLPLAEGERLLDFEVGATRPYGELPAPFHDLTENARVEVGVGSDALYFRVQSKSSKGDVARIPWNRVVVFGPHQAEGRWKRWSLRGELTNGSRIRLSLTGRPRPSLERSLHGLVAPYEPLPGEP